MNINDVIEKSRKRKLIERSILLTLVLVSFIWFSIFDFFFSYAYRIDGFNDLQWFAFWTHLSNTLALVWISLAAIAVWTNNDKLEKIIQHWNIKNTTYTFILVTGIVFIAVAYFPVVIAYSTAGPIKELQELVIRMGFDGFIIDADLDGVNSIEDLLNNYDDTLWVYQVLKGKQTWFETANGRNVVTDPSALYRFMVISGTTLKHIVVPVIFGYLAFTELGYYRTRNISDKNRSMIQFIWPCMYLVYAVSLSAAGVFLPPYPVIDFGFTEVFYIYHPELLQQCMIVITWGILDITVGILFVGISFFQNYWNRRVLEKINKKVEIV